MNRNEKVIEKVNELFKDWKKLDLDTQILLFSIFTEKDKLLISKASLMSLFGISKPTLYRWMRNNGYKYFIGEEPSRLSRGKLKKAGQQEIDIGDEWIKRDF